MNKIITLAFFALLFSVNAFAHEAFTLVSSVKKTIKLAELIELEKARTLGEKDNQNLTFTENEIYLIVKTGPEDDMLSYRIQGVRNPNLIVPADATLKILFVNSDEDMTHDIRFGHIIADFGITPNTAETVGTNRLEHKAEDETMQAEEIVIKPSEDGAYKFFCSVRGHAKGGMWGNIFVGVKPGDKVKVAEKTEHIHSPDENMEMPGMKMDDKKSDPMPDMKMPDKKPDEMSDMKMSDKKSDEMSDMNMPGMSHDSMKMAAVTDINSPITREIFQSKNLNVGLGAKTTFYQNPSSISSYYGGTDHQGLQIFMRIRPSLMK